MTKQLRVGYLLPAYGGFIVSEHARMWTEFGFCAAASSERFALVLMGYRDICGIDMARSKIMDDAVEAGLDWLLMIDSDTWVEDGQALLQMISDADKQDASIVVAPVRQRRVGDGESHLMIYRKGMPHFMELPRRDGLFPIDRAATACMAIHLDDIVRELDQPWFRFTPTAAEDLDFCDRVKDRGGIILCDPRVRTFHRSRPAVLASYTE